MSKTCHPFRRRSVGVVIVLLGCVTLCAPPSARAQTESTAVAMAGPDGEDVRRVARAAQAAFERRRVRYLPLGPPVGSTMCDGTVGRFCWWAEDGEWYPVPEDERIVEMRAALVTTLDSLQGMAPDDDWILGQRVWYRAKSDAWQDAEAVARSCPSRTRWWCAALEGYALHQGGAYVRAERRFGAALAAMDEERRDRWTRPRWSVDGEIRDAIESLADTDELPSYLQTLWLFADPLYLEPGNDRKTAHFARWVAVELRREARNPFRLRWGEDLTQLTVRNGWEVGWERSTGFTYTGVDEAIGRKHPEARDYMPPDRALRWPFDGDAEDLIADRRDSRSLYAPAYAPVLLPMETRLQLFPRGPTTVLIATQSLPEDTTFHASHDHPKPWMEPGLAEGVEDRRGLFALPLAPLAADPERVEATRAEPFAVVAVGDTEGALMLEVPTGTYLVSAESHSPSRRRAGRWRSIVPERRALDDLATVSDLLLLRPDVDPLPESLEEALPSIRSDRKVLVGEALVVAWEVFGLGFRPESLRFELSVERSDRSVIGRVGDFLGLSDGPQPVELTWEEPGPTRPGPVLFSLRVDVPDADPGRYRLRLRLHTEGRTAAEREVDFEIVSPTR